MAGTVRLYPLDTAGRWKGDRLAVLPGHRSSFVGVKLVRYAVSCALLAGGREMEATVQPANTTFFERLGWRCDGPIASHYGQPHQPMLIDLADVPVFSAGRPVGVTLHPLADPAESSPLLVAF